MPIKAIVKKITHNIILTKSSKRAFLLILVVMMSSFECIFLFELTSKLTPNFI